MLSLRSGLLLLGQAKSKSPSVADLYRFHIGNRGKPERSESLLLLGQAKSKSPSVADLYRFHIGNRGKPERSESITIPAYARMTAVC
ncbi:hypothetical protein ASE74_16840 [Pedobacter sp. Leaf216]|nr:hypothetical protein ASE74_16840 [Pedobacter sp. Leaf216]